MASWGRFWCSWLALCTLQIVSGDPSLRSEAFAESLVLRPLPDGKVLGHFQFVNELGKARQDGHHYKLFPKAIYQIGQKFHIQEMELSFTQGRWDHRLWGGLTGLESADVKPGGVELWAQFHHSNQEVDTLWRNLTHALSGLFCASINFLEDPAMVSKWRVSSQGSLEGAGYMGAVRQGALPREAVCTENLTPWLKLLPCRDRAGLSTLLDRPRIHNGNYYSLRVHVKAGNGMDRPLGSFRLSQTLTVVLKSSDTSAAPWPNWSLSSLFGKSLNGSCPLATSSRVSVELETNLVEALQRAENQSHISGMLSISEDAHAYAQNEASTNLDVTSNNIFHLNMAPDSVSKQALGSASGAPSLFLNYDVGKYSKTHQLNVGMSWQASCSWSPRQGPFRATQFLTGRGSGRGSIVSLVHANSDGCNSLRQNLLWCPVSEEDDGSPEIDVTTFQIVPWYVRLYMHTLKVVVDGVQVKKRVKLKLSPADDRKSPSVVEIGITIPRNSSMVVVSVEIERGYLRIDEHPPDANRGFDLPSALFTFASSTRGQDSVQIYSDNLLVLLATPDFSMPYNVITFTMTSLALYFGSLLNSLRLRSLTDDMSQQPPAAQISNKIRKLVALFTGRKKLKTL